MFPNRAPGTAVHNRPPARAGLLDHRAAATIVALCCILVFAPSTAAQDEGRVTAGLAALYTFSEGSGDLVADTSGAFATPLDLTLTTPGTATWLDGGGLALEAPTTLISNGVALDPALAVQASGELTVEAWLRTADLDQSGPARIVSLSDGNHDRNFALGQGRWGWQPTDTFDFRLRTTATDDNGRPSSTTPAGTVLPEIQHVVVTRRSDGTVEAYVGGESVFTGQVAGDLSNWDVGYVLALGDEVGGGRPWLGELHLVALYSRALSGAEVAQNFAAGPGSRPARITDGQRALYTFLEGSGGQVADVSGVGSALDLTVADPAAVTWLDGGGIALESPTVLESAGAADKISDAVALSGALTLEAWLAPTDLTLGGPARIVSLSDGWHDRNLTLGQGDGAGGTDFYDLRLRSTATNANGYPSTTTPAGSLEAGLQHVVATRSADDWIRLYIDDRLVTSRRRTGSLAGWDSAYPLLLGNETTGDRPWLGELHLVAIYDRALDSGEITQNYYAGPPTAGGGSPPDPEPGDDPDLPAPEIGPQAAILLEAGQSHQFTASWPPGTPEELVNAPLIWTSADPAIATVDANGLVHMHTDKALAVITAHADAATPHLPGFGSVTSGAVVRPGARILPAEDLLSQSLIDVEEGSLEFVVAANSGTSTLQVGDLASFGDRGALVIDSIGSVAEGLRLSGTVPTLEDGFEELNIRVDEAANRVLWGVLQDAQGLNEPQANSLERSHGRDAGVDCALKAVTTYGIDPSTDFEIRLSGGKITKFALLADLGLELAMEQLSIDLEFECEVEVANIFLSLVPSPPPIPLWYKFSYPITVGGGFTFNPAVDSVVGPGLELYQQLSAGLEVTDGTPDFSMDSDTPQPAFLIGDAVQDFAASIDATFGAFAKIEAGVVRLGLLVLPTRDPFIELDVGVLEVRAGVEATIPATGRLLPSPNYRNPELDGVVTIDLKGLKVQTGPDVNRVLEWIGSSGVQTSFLGLRIFETRYPFPIPLAPTFAPDTVYLQSADPSQLPFSFATIEQEVPWPSWLPQPLDYFEVWGRPAGTDDNFQFLWQLDENQGSIIPTPEHEGTWVTRTVGYYTFNDWIPRILAGQPVVSPNTEVITVRDRSAMVIEGTEALESIIQGVNSVHSTTVTVGNVDITPLDYEISVTGALVTVDGDVATQTLGLQPGNTRGHTVQTTCDDTAAARTGTLTVRSLTDPEDVYSFLIAFSCTTLEFSPPRLDVKGSVDGEIYTEFQAVSRMAVGSQWVLEGIRNNAPADVTVVDSIAIEAFGTFDMSSLVECKAAGSGTALATFIPDPFTTSARDPVHLFIDITCQDRRGGGLSWGDPHLETFDRVRYDFQAVGEYVLARSPGFEVQARQEGSGGVSRNTAIAVGVDSDRIAFYGTAPEGGGRVMENGSAVTLTDRTTLELAGGGVVRRYGDDYTVEAPDGTYARVSHRGRYLRVTVQPVDGLAGTFEGLLGDFDGDPANDFALRDGTPLGSPPSFLELYDCSVGRCLAYDDPGGWLIRDAAESLFDYSPGEGPGTFIPATQYPIEPVDLTQFSDAVRSWASAQCVAAGILDPVLLDACVLDLVVTGDVEMGTDAAVIEDQEAPPVGLEVCDGVDNDQNGEVDENDVCACTAAEFQGTTYQFCGAKVPWLTARSACLARGLDLGRIGDPAENAWVFDHLATLPGAEDRWMGLTDLATEDVWLWTDGSPVVWSSWGADQPSNSNDTEHCGQFVAGFGDWNDLPCEWEVAFFCE